jgi:hypothetical protein
VPKGVYERHPGGHEVVLSSPSGAWQLAPVTTKPSDAEWRSACVLLCPVSCRSHAVSPTWAHDGETRREWIRAVYGRLAGQQREGG